MALLRKLALGGWPSLLVSMLPYLAFAALVAAYLFERQHAIVVTRERDRIIRVLDPSGQTSPDQALIVAQRVITERDAARTALTVTAANYRRATAQAQAADLSHARAVERRDAAIAGAVQHDLETQLASARADADRHARELRAAAAAGAPPGTDRGGGGAAGVSRPADPAGGAAGAGPAAELDDARACATGIILAEGWQRWWADVSVAPR